MGADLAPFPPPPQGRCRLPISSPAATPLKVRPVQIPPEPGANLELHKSIEWSQENGMCVSVWGPYEVCKELYDNFLSLKCRLEGGGHTYVVPSRFYPWRGATDCAHAL